MSEKKPNLKKILEFAKLLTNFRDVTRVIWANGTKRYENDVEHSYMLTMLADYIISVDNLSLDRNKVMRYAMIHDLVEVYAGDTYIYHHDKKFIASKQKREANALKKLIKQFPEHMTIWKDVEAFEKMTDDESRFVYALDKVQPVIQLYLDGGRSWKHEKVHLHQVIEHKSSKVKVSPVVEKYWLELVKILERNQKTLFPK